MRTRLAALGVAALAGLTILALAAPAQATHDTKRIQAGPMVFGPNGFGGVSCPKGTTVVTGGYTAPEGQELKDVKLSQPMAPETVYPHWTTGPDETGWYVQNGETSQTLTVWADCATEHEPEPEAKDCEAYETPSGGNLCRYTEVDGDLDCANLAAQDRPVKVIEVGTDPYGLDADKDGVGCEVEPTEEPSEQPSTTPSTSAPPAAGGSLPVTGAPVAGLAIGGVALLGAGAGLLLARRRRVRFTA